MHNLLYKLLAKRKIDKVDELDEEEKSNFDNWQAILSKSELSTGDIREFCQSQCEVIKQKWADYNVEQARKNELIPYFTVYNTLLNAIDSPQASREALEKHLIQLINN